MKIDLNADLAEGLKTDFELLDFVTSANLACGFHAGGPTTMRQTVEWCLEKKVAVGAHPGWPDRANFGRTEMHFSEAEIEDLVLYQIGALAGFLQKNGARLSHVKPHGALYNQAARDPKMAAAIARAVVDFDKKLVLFGLSESHLISEAEKIGLATRSEVFADRTYQNDGSLTPRNRPGALISSVEKMKAQVIQFIENQEVTTVSGKLISVKAETICLHGDGPQALEFARTIHDIMIRSVSIVR